MSAVAKLPLRASSTDLRGQHAELVAQLESAQADLAEGKIEHTAVVAMRARRDELVDRIAGAEILERRDAEKRATEERHRLLGELTRSGEEHGLIAHKRDADAFAARAQAIEASLAELLSDIHSRARAGHAARERAEQIAAQLEVVMPEIPHHSVSALIRHVQRAIAEAQHAARRDLQDAAELPDLVRAWRE